MGRRLNKKTSRWYQRSVGIIDAVISDHMHECLKPVELRRLVDKAYPFGIRAHWPYKNWLAARADLFAKHGISTPKQLRAVQRRQEAIQREIDESPLFIKSRSVVTPDPNQQSIPGLTASTPEGSHDRSAETK